MPWMPGIPHDQGTEPQGTINPLGVVAHRTYGSWNGDYAVGKGSNPPVGFHFLVGPEQGQWCQFYDTTVRCAHGGSNANANDISVGIEVTGRNEDPMTQWQLDRCRDIVNWLEQTHGIARTYRFSTAHDLRADFGYVPHSAVAESDHSDYWTVDDWDRIIGTTTGRNPDMILVRTPNGNVHIVGLAGPVHVQTPTDQKELEHALREPDYVAEITDGMYQRLSAYVPSDD